VYCVRGDCHNDTIAHLEVAVAKALTDGRRDHRVPRAIGGISRGRRDLGAGGGRGQVGARDKKSGDGLRLALSADRK
jgi:hypothetical protein